MTPLRTIAAIPMTPGKTTWTVQIAPVAASIRWNAIAVAGSKDSLSEIGPTESGVDAMSKDDVIEAMVLGARAFDTGVQYADNPYSIYEPGQFSASIAWSSGWREKSKEQEKKRVAAFERVYGVNAKRRGQYD